MTTLQLLLWQPEKMKDGLTDNFLWIYKDQFNKFIGNQYGTYGRKFIKTTQKDT